MKRAYRSVRWMAILSCAALYNTGCSSKSEGQSAKDTGTARQAVSGPAVAAPNAAPVSKSVSASTAPSSGVAPGRLIVKYKSDGNYAVTQCAERWMQERRSFKDATADHSNSLDGLHQRLGVTRAHAIVPGRRGLATHDAKQHLAARSALQAQRAGVQPGPKARTLANLVNLYVLEVPNEANIRDLARQVAADPHVEYAQPDFLITTDATPNDPYFSSSGSWGQLENDLWGIKRISAPLGWNTTQGEGVVVAVVDTGLDMTHPDIAGNVWQNADEIPGNGIDDDNNGFIDDVNGWNFADNKADINDDYGHGTHVSGTIAAVGNNGIGVIGVAPKAKIMPVRGLGAGTGSLSTAAQGLTYAIQNGARVINNSWGCSRACPENPIVEDVVNLAHDAGVTVVFSAGNANEDISQYSPQNQPNVIVVGASDPIDQRASFSNFGFIDLNAPGAGTNVSPPDFEPMRGILSLRATTCAICPPELLVGDRYLRQAGTSMAAPHVAGAAALLLSAHPNFTPEQVRQAMRRSCADSATPGFDLESGYGRLNISAALYETAPLAALISSPIKTLDGTSVDVTGIVAGTGFANYVLEYGLGTTPTAFTTLAAAPVQVNGAKLGTWNYSQIPDGVHTLRVRAQATDGRIYEDRQRVVLDRVAITEPSFDYYVTGSLDVYGNQLVNIRGTAGPGDFQSYEIAIQTLDGTPVPGANVQLSNGGTARVFNGVLGVWNTAGMPAGGYQIALTVHSTSGSTITGTTRAVVDTTLHAGWPINFSPAPIWERQLGITDTLTLADVNADGKADVIVGYDATVAVYDHTGAPLTGWPQSVDPLGRGSRMDRSPVVADITGDGVVEVIGANRDGLIMVWRNNGQLLYQTQLTNVPCTASYCSPSLAVEDFDADGVSDVIATDSSGDLAVLRSKDKMVPYYKQTLGNRILSAPAVGDVNGDGKPEIAVAVSDQFSVSPRTTDLYVFGAQGVLSGWPKRVSSGVTSYDQANPVIGDVNRDGKFDIVVTSHLGDISAFNANGTLLTGFPRATKSVFAHTPALGDFNRDGLLDILVGTAPDGANSAESDLFAFHNDGTILPGWPSKVVTPTASNFGFGAAVMADIDGDNAVEAIVGTDSFTQDPYHALQALHADGSVVAGFPKPTVYHGGSSTCTAAIADVDGDGLLEMAWLDLTGKLYLWDLTAPAYAPSPWPMFQHDARHTGRADVVPQFRATFESHDNSPTNNIIQPRVRIVNNSGSSVPLSQLTLRYWYTTETKPNAQLFQVYFAQNESNWSSIPTTAITSKFTTVARPLADTYMQMGFTSTAGTLANGAAAAVEFNIHAQNWGNYQETNDYSYMSSAARFDWSRVTIYRNGVLVWGTEP